MENFVESHFYFKSFVNYIKCFYLRIKHFVCLCGTYCHNINLIKTEPLQFRIITLLLVISSTS